MANPRKSERLANTVPSKKADDTLTSLDLFTEDVPPGLQVMPLEAESTVLSPLSNLSVEERKAHSSSPIRGVSLGIITVWNANQNTRVQSDLAPIRQWISEVDARALYCSFGHSETVPETYEDSSEDESEAITINIHRASRLKVVKTPCDIHLGRPKKRATSKLGFSSRRSGASISIISRRHRTTGVLGHFVINRLHSNFFVNEVNIPFNRMVGPLSDFAVIQVGDDVAFWWANGTAFDYKPLDKSRKRSTDEIGDAANSAENGRSKKKLKVNSGSHIDTVENSERSPSLSWESIFDGGLSKWEAQLEKKGTSEELPPDLEEGMANFVVTDAIAAVWEPMGKPTGYGPAEMFETRDRETQINVQRTACGQHERTFIMPLVYGEQDAEESSDHGHSEDGDLANKHKAMKEDWENIGHFVLAIASKSTGPFKSTKPSGAGKSRGRMIVSLQIWDSKPGFVEKTIILKDAKAVVQYSGWMGLSRTGRVWDVEPLLAFRSTTFEKTPNQGEESLHCGLYVVLNAWAHILGIKTTKREKFVPKGKTLDDFHRMGVKMVNLVLAGCMDTRTIQAFLKVYGYSVGEKINKLVVNVTTKEMDGNGEKLENDIVAKRNDDVAAIVAADAVWQNANGGYLWP